MWRSILQAVFPARCGGCAAPAAALCDDCHRKLRAAPHGPPPTGVDWWVAPFSYEGPLRELVARAKYREARTGLPWLASEIAAALRAAGASRPGVVDVVTWPPTTAARRRRRGFDQAEVLARLVARDLARPARPLLTRRAGPPQTGRSRAERVAGLDLAACRRADGLGVLVVDDVATTGATLTAAAGALRQAGARSVGAATAARTRRKSDTARPVPLKAPERGADTWIEPTYGARSPPW